MNKFLKIVLVIIVVGAVGVGTYFAYTFFFQPENVIGPTEEPTVNEFGEAIPKKIVSDAIVDYWVNRKTGEVYYFSENGEINKVLANGTGEIVSSQSIDKIGGLKPSFDGTAALVSIGHPKAGGFAVFNLNSKIWTPLPAGTVAAAWDPASSNRLIYLADTGTFSRLSFFNLTDSKSTEVQRFSQKDLELEWVSPNAVFLIEKPSREYASSIRSFNLQNKNVQTLVREEMGALVKWNKTGQLGLKWSNGLVVIDGAGRTLSRVNLKTLPSKCGFSDSQIYCAVPADQNSVSSSLYPDDYLKRGVKFRDDLFVMPLLSVGEPEILAIRLGALEADADRLEVAGNQLLFLNRFDKNLYLLEL